MGKERKFGKVWESSRQSNMNHAIIHCTKVIIIQGTIIGSAEFRCQREQFHKGRHRIDLRKENMVEKQYITLTWKAESKQ